jgi:hypothetical protein
VKKICLWALGAIGALLLVEAPSWGKLDVASCSRNSRHAATRCHVAQHNNPYGMTVGGNIYERINSTIYPPVSVIRAFTMALIQTLELSSSCTGTQAGREPRERAERFTSENTSGRPDSKRGPDQ